MKNNFEIFKFDFLKKNKKDKNVNLDEIAELKFSIDKKTNTLLIENYANRSQSSHVNTINDTIFSSKENENSNILINDSDSYNRKFIKIDPMVDVSLETVVSSKEQTEVPVVHHEETQENNSLQQTIETKSNMNVIHFDLDSMTDPNATSSVLNQIESNLSDEEIEDMIDDDKLNQLPEQKIIENPVEEKIAPISIFKTSDIDSMHKVVFELDPILEPEIVSSVAKNDEEKIDHQEQDTIPSESTSLSEDDNTQNETKEEVIEEPKETPSEDNNVKEEYINKEETSNSVQEETLDDDIGKMFDSLNDDNQEENKQETNETLQDEDQQFNKLLNEEDFNDIKSEEVDNLIEEDLLIIDEFFKKEVNRQENDLIAKSFSDKL